MPLDGSKLAEEALLTAAELAESLSASIVLLRVVPPPVPGRFYSLGLLERVQQERSKEAEAYLASVAARLTADRLRVDTHVLFGQVAASLVRFTEVERSDLIIMGSHGLGGRSRHVFGSVAQKVLHSSRCPVLIVPPAPEEWAREEELEEQEADQALLALVSSSPVPAARR